MASREIEIKIQITKGQLELLSKWLKKNADYVRTEKQLDYYFDHPKLGMTYKHKEGFKDSIDYFRVRFSGNTQSTCLKHFHEDPEKPGHYTHCDEFETEVNDGKILMKLYKSLGFKKSAAIDKTRKTYKYKSIEIDVDTVKDLGIFVELELKRQVKDVKKGKAELFNLLKEIGISTFHLTNRGYVSMFWNPDFEFGEKMSI